MKLLIIEPWFTGRGHPAQSLINTASAIGKNVGIDYLVSFDNDSKSYLKLIDHLSEWGCVYKFRVTTQTGKSNTIKALFSLVRLRLGGHSYQRVFFFDATLPVLAILWPIFSFVLGVKRISVLHLHGPEVIGGGWIGRAIIKVFLTRADVWLYLRTEELAQAWFSSFTGKICRLPSLEIPDTDDTDVGNDQACTTDTRFCSKVKFGIIGQIRPGKGIDWLVPLFKNDSGIGMLTVAGSYYDQKCRDELTVLEDFDGFINRFLAEDEMLKLAAAQDYLLMLYNQDWDPRLESAVLYLAARVNRPVIVYGGSWSGRMVKEYSCGLLAHNDVKQTVELLRGVPRPGTSKYANLCQGMNVFKKAHSVASLRNEVLNELLK